VFFIKFNSGRKARFPFSAMPFKKSRGVMFHLDGLLFHYFIS